VSDDNATKRQTELGEQHPDPNFIFLWWDSLYQSFMNQVRQTDKPTYDAEDCEKIRMYPEDIIRLLYKLQSENNELRTKNESLNKSLKEEKKSLFKWLSGKNEEIDRLDRLKIKNNQKVATLQYQIRDLKSSLQQREKSLQRLEKDYNSIQDERTHLLNEIASIKTGDADTPQHNSLFEEFNELKNQDFKSLSNKIFSLFRKCQPNSQVVRKSEIAKIRYTLSKEILLKGLEISKNRNIADADIKKIVNSLKEELDKYCGGTENLAAGVLEEFEKVSNNLASLVEKGLKLVDRINHAIPPGELLWFEKKESVPFNPEIHEAAHGFEEMGKIELTLHPGYMIYESQTGKKRVFEKALVRTISD
jgi:DNA repair exonuclease SbcCD ATPase subunit